MNMQIAGGCLCKAVRYRCTAQPITTRVCWCRLCQYLGSGNATVNVCFASEAVSVEGQMTDYVSVADSGNVMHRKFCPTCGTQLFSSAEARPHLLFVRAEGARGRGLEGVGRPFFQGCAARCRQPRPAELPRLLVPANLRRHELAFKHYQRALEIDPRHKGAHEYIGEAYLEIGDLASAERHLAILKSLCPLSCEQLEDLQREVVAFRQNNVAAPKR